ncbi:uncharacterized protein LOC119094090 [Pollicipes pollicipes]|uniref:uncharacterized protein LOC119094090 n=1 Tax=Pollicipes pollicipes TaxID=41117 RepID=UPI001884AF94|nr:uncharacterized protein LOC119094090 [Pollicipes pollicipes]
MSATAGRGLAELPCDVDPASGRDVMHLVLWYKAGSGAPFYSYDTRGGRTSQGTHWASEDSLGERSRLDPRPGAYRLMISSVSERDAGLYRCRADFKASPTLNARVNLTVIGAPAPNVTWWLAGALVDDTWSHNGDLTSNTLQVTQLQRSNLGQLYTCLASNSLLLPPRSVSVGLDITCECFWGLRVSPVGVSRMWVCHL